MSEQKTGSRQARIGHQIHDEFTGCMDIPGRILGFACIVLAHAEHDIKRVAPNGIEKNCKLPD